MREPRVRDAYPLWGWVAMVALVALSFVSIAQRYRVEQRNRGVGVLLEVEPLQALATLTGRPLAEVLSEAKAHGLSGVAITEETIADLLRSGSLRREGSSLVAIDDAARARVERGLALRLGADRGRLPARGLDPRLSDTVAVGLDPTAAAAARDAGLTIVARLANPNGISPEAIRATIAWAGELGAQVFLPVGDQALGQRDLLAVTAEALRESDMLYASPEFARIAGEAALAARVEDRLIRLHSLQTAEADRLSPSEFVDRFARAYKERNIRLLLLRPPPTAAADPIAALHERLEAVRRGIEKEGGRVVPRPRPFEEPDVPAWLFPLLALAAGVATAAGASVLLPSGPWRWAVALIALVLAGLAATEGTRPLAATGFAFAMPVVGYAWLMGRRGKSLIGGYAGVTLFSLAGGLAVAGLLNGASYFVRTDQFFAVKLAHFGPIAAVGLILLFDRIDPRTLWRQPAAWGPAVLSIAVLVALAFMALRTGNDNPAAVSGLELRLRGLLDDLLPTRPRTKEFLVGHPAMVLGLGLLATGRQALGGWAALALTLGAIGQTSIVNTLCHLHTPIDVGLSRVAIGWALGGGVGFVIWILLRPRIDR
jgi:MFS family permease